MVLAKATFAEVALKLSVTSLGGLTGSTFLGFTLVACQIYEVSARDSVHRPICHWLSAEASVEAEGWSIPVQHPPLQAPIVIVQAFFGEVGEQ
jgi:hypothetical protein